MPIHTLRLGPWSAASQLHCLANLGGLEGFSASDGGGDGLQAFQWSLASLETLTAEGPMEQHGAVLRAFSVVELWRLRRMCRAFHE